MRYKYTKSRDHKLFLHGTPIENKMSVEVMFTNMEGERTYGKKEQAREIYEKEERNEKKGEENKSKNKSKKNATTYDTACEGRRHAR